MIESAPPAEDGDLFSAELGVLEGTGARGSRVYVVEEQREETAPNESTSQRQGMITHVQQSIHV